MVGQPEIIIGGKIEEGFAIELKMRRLWRIHAAQFAIEPLFSDLVQALIELRSEIVCLRRIHCAAIPSGRTAHSPSIILAATLPRWWTAASLLASIFPL